jgi:hypothetical protein
MLRILLIFILLAASMQAQQPASKTLGRSLRTSAQLSNRNTPFQVLPANYIATEADLGFDAAGLPLRASLRLNSAHRQGQYQLNSITLQLDIQRWKAELQQKLLEKLVAGGEDSAGREHLLAALEQQRGMRIATMHESLRKRYGGKLPQPDLQQFAEAKRKLPGLKTALKQPMYVKATSLWQN